MYPSLVIEVFINKLYAWRMWAVLTPDQDPEVEFRRACESAPLATFRLLTVTAYRPAGNEITSCSAPASTTPACRKTPSKTSGSGSKS